MVFPEKLASNRTFWFPPSLSVVIADRVVAPLAEPTEFFNKLNVKTVSGISRSKQREKYDRVKAAELPQNGIKLIEIPYSVFTCDELNRIVRDHEQDLKRVTDFLKPEQYTTKTDSVE